MKYPLILLILAFSILTLYGCTKSKEGVIASTTQPPNMKNDFQESGKSVILSFQGETLLITHGEFIKNQIEYSSDSQFDLDSLGNKSLSEIIGDIVFVRSGGSSIFYSLLPVNGAKAYYPGVDDIGYKYCAENIKLYSNGSIPEFLNGKPICVLTNEGNLAIINYVQESFLNTESEIQAKIEVWLWWHNN
jgi:hypothetical protein